jgi:hypothetical protein
LELAAMEMVPFPIPEAPAVIVSQEALLVVVHAQPVPAVTPTDAVPPAEPISTAVTVAPKVQEELKVVNEKIAELVLPAVFFATTCQ